MPFQEVLIHVARQRDAVFTDESCWLTALRPAKAGQQVGLQSLGSILGNAEPCSLWMSVGFTGLCFSADCILLSEKRNYFSSCWN